MKNIKFKFLKTPFFCKYCNILIKPLDLIIIIVDDRYMAGCPRCKSPFHLSRKEAKIRMDVKL